jgi:hypothetical protein
LKQRPQRKPQAHLQTLRLPIQHRMLRRPQRQTPVPTPMLLVKATRRTLRRA